MPLRTAIVALTILSSLAGCGGDSSFPASPAVPMDRTGRWQQDVDTFGRQLASSHVNLFFQLSRERFDSEVATLRAGVPSLDEASIVVGMMRILAMVGDSHTTLDVGTFNGFRQLPLRFEWFSDGIFVVAAAEPFRETLGMRVRRLGVAPIEAVVEALTEVIPHENEAWLRFSAVSILSIPEVLEALSLAPDASAVALELEGENGRAVSVEIPAEPRRPTAFVDAGPEVVPLYRQRPGDNYWLALLEDSGTLYVQYRRASDAGAEPFSAFAGRIVQLLDTEPVRALVIDLRHNSGGNSSLLEPLLGALERRPQWSSGEGLYTIIGRATFSSAIINAVDLKRRARAILVGEPTGGKPNHYGQVASFTLPNSGIRISYSTRFFRLLSDSDPASLEPDVRVELSSRDYLEGRDPVLETILDLVGR